MLCVQCPGPPGSCSPVRTLCVWCCVYGVLGLLAPVHRCARFVCGVACTASWASWLLFTGVHALCVVLRVRCPGPPGSCSPVRTPCVWCCVYGVLGLPAPVHRCARPVCGVARTVSWASWLLFTGAHALRMVLCVRCPGPPGSCSPVRTLCVWCCVYGVLGLLAPVHRCARFVCGVACTASWASWLLFTGVHALCVVLPVRCPGLPGSCSPVCTPCVWCCVYGVLGPLAPVHRCARPACGVVCTVSWAFRLLFTGVHALCVVLRLRCPGPPGSCSPVRTPCVWCCVYGVLGLPAPVHRCARSACGVVCTVSWASRLLFTSAHALRVVLCVRCPGPPGSCSPVRTPCVWCCVYGVLGLPAPVHRCAPLLVVLRVRCPGPPGSCSPVRTPCVWCCLYGVLGLPAPVHRCARPVCGVACTVSRASWLLFIGAHALRVVFSVRCPGPPGSCSPVRTPCVWCCVYGVLGSLAPVHRCARPACGVVCTVSWAFRLLFTGVYALCVVLRIRCLGPPGSCSPVRTPCVWCCVYGVLGHPAPVHRCARSACGVACTQSAFRALSVEEVDTNPVKTKRETEKDAGKIRANEGVDHGHDPTSDSTFEGAPSASGLHASPSPITTTLPTPDPAAATFTPITTPPMAEGTGFTCMPTYPAYGVNPPTTRFQRQLLPVSRWPPVLRRDGMRLTITILYPLRERMWMFLGMQP